MKKKQYQKSAMQVVQLQHHQQLIAGSGPGAQSLSLPGDEGITLAPDGFADDEDDY